MAFTLLKFDQYKKYVSGAQNVTTGLTMNDAGEYTSTRYQDYGTLGDKTFAGTNGYLNPIGSANVFYLDCTFTASTHMYAAFNVRQEEDATETERLALRNGTTSIVGIGNDIGGNDYTGIYKNGTSVASIEPARAVTRVAGSFTLVEFYYYLHATTGVIKVWIDRNLVYSFTGNTDFTTGAGADRWSLSANSADSYEMRDFYVGTVAAEGDCPRKAFSVVQLPVDSDTLTTNWTTGGANHYGEVDDETVSDKATTEINATSATAKCKFGIDTQYLPSLSTPYAVKVLPVAIRSAGAPSVCDARAIIDSNGTEAQGSWLALSDTTWKHASPTYFLTNPDTAGAWTSSAVSALDVGVELRVQP